MALPEDTQQLSPDVTPQRYPNLVRVSAIQDVNSGSGDDPPKLGEGQSPSSPSNGRVRSKELESPTEGSGKNEKEDERSMSKRKKMEEAPADGTAIEEENGEIGEGKARINWEPRDLVMVTVEQPEEVVARMKIRAALSSFHMIHQKLLQKEESKSKQPGQAMMILLRAYKLFKEGNNVIDTRKHVGSVPGVDVGDEFQFRVELCVANVHCQIPGTIDFANINGRNLAVSIISSGNHADYLKNSDVLVFTGTGSPSEDQKLAYGNLALKNCIDARTPVRVVRGINGKKKSIRYIYDGLFTVEKYWTIKGKKGYNVFMFQLRRMLGQPELPVKTVTSHSSKTIYGLRMEDISNGDEKVPISVVNSIDNELPMPFIYTTKIIYPSNFQPTSATGCDCVNGCSDSGKYCACAVKNGGEIPFNNSGALIKAKPLVYECGPNCKCPPSCCNRVSQHGIKFPLVIFKTEKTGWGVRCLTSIPSGSFVCEYIGELLEDEEAQKRDNDDYLFAIGNNYYDESLWEGLSTFIPDLQKKDGCAVVEDGGFTLDASQYGNVGKFINHSCTPNLYAQNLLYDHNDKRIPRVALFATEDIPPLQELTYDYNYGIDQVHDSDGNIRKKACYCGSTECTGRLY